MPLWLFVIIVILWLALLPTAYAGLIGAPYAPTRRPVVKKAFQKFNVGEDDVVVDLGSGDGSILLEATARGAKALGYELSPIMWLVSKFRGANVKYANFYKQTLPEDTTVVFAFLMPKIMPRIVKYLRKQKLPHGKLFMAYTFPLPQDITPLTIIRENKCGPIYVYDLKELTTV